jgi:hypothetical protein
MKLKVSFSNVKSGNCSIDIKTNETISYEENDKKNSRIHLLEILIIITGFVFVGTQNPLQDDIKFPIFIFGMFVFLVLILLIASFSLLAIWKIKEELMINRIITVTQVFFSFMLILYFIINGVLTPLKPQDMFFVVEPFASSIFFLAMSLLLTYIFVDDIKSVIIPLVPAALICLVLLLYIHFYEVVI